MAGNSASSNGELLDQIQTTPDPGRAGPSITDLLEKQQPEIEKALPASMSAETFNRIALTTYRTENLMKCTPHSFLACLMLCAQLGFEPGPLGYVYFVPRKAKKNINGREQWVTEVTFQIGYQGWADLARRSGEIGKIEANPVYAEDEFDFEIGTSEFLRHKPSMTLDHGLLGSGRSGPIDPSAPTPTHVYCIVQLMNGFSHFRVMTWNDAMAHKGYSQTDYVWKQFPLQMALKTVFLRLKTWLPRSIQMDRAALHDNTTPAALLPNMLDQARPIDPIEVESVETIEKKDEPDPVAEMKALRASLSDARAEALADFLSSNEIPERSDDQSPEQMAKIRAWFGDLDPDGE